ncbi:MAG: hypothetical protein L3J32_08450 [Rhizobiaceae bacterium]|nr:hypothetical protein [Rhizobiaceae bacterium]
MEQVIQLKTIRDEALARLQLNADFKLVNSLDALIKDLEAVLSPLESVSEFEEKKADDEESQLLQEMDSVSLEEVNETPDPAIDIVETLESEQSDDVVSTLEALEAELSQEKIDKTAADFKADEGKSQPDAMAN